MAAGSWFRTSLVAMACATSAWLGACIGESEQVIQPSVPVGKAISIDLVHGAPEAQGPYERLVPSLPPGTAAAALSISQGHALVGTDSGVWAAHPELTDRVVPLPLRHAHGDPERTGAIHGFARRAHGGVLAAAEAGLFHDLDGALYLSPLSAVLPGPVKQVSSHGEGTSEELWLLPTRGAPGEVWVVNSMGLRVLRLSVEASPDAAVALGNGKGLLSAGGALYEVDVAARSAELLRDDFGTVHAVDRSAAGFLFFGTDRGLVVRTPEGKWTRHTLVDSAFESIAPPPVRAVFAGIGAQVFLSTDERVLQLGGNGLIELAERTGPSPGVARDAAGDTWITDEGAAVRLLTGAEVGFAQHVKPFFSAHCTACHTDGNGAPIIDLEDYEVAKQQSDRIVIRLEAAGVSPMPPQSVEILTRQQYAVVLRWVAGGMKP